MLLIQRIVVKYIESLVTLLVQLFVHDSQVTTFLQDFFNSEAKASELENLEEMYTQQYMVSDGTNRLVRIFNYILHTFFRCSVSC